MRPSASVDWLVWMRQSRSVWAKALMPQRWYTSMRCEVSTP